MQTRLKLLLIGHDNLFHDSEVFQTDFLGSVSRDMGKSEWADSVTIKEVLKKLILRKYDYIILPEVFLLRVGWQNPRSRKHQLARIIYRLSYSKIFTGLVRAFLRVWIKPKTIFFIGRFEQSGLHRQIFQFFPKARLYRTTSRSEIQCYGNLVAKPLNWWLNLGHYPEYRSPALKERSVDVFFAGQTSIIERQKAPLLKVECEKAGARFYWPDERLDFDQFIRVVCDSKIAWSPEGTSWQCWRHYEALYYGAIPLINKPHESVYTTLKHGETALFYSDLEEAIDMIEKVRSGKLDLSLSMEERRQFVIDHHSEQAVRDYLTRELLECSTIKNEYVSS